MKEEHYHFIGIGGIGMSALARILLDKKTKVSGSDLSLNDTLKDLMEKGAQVSLSQKGEFMESETKIVYSSGIKKNNLEFKSAEEKNCKLLHRSDLLKELMDGYKALAVAGTHGKTTVSSLLVYVLTQAKFDPTFAVGGMIKGLGNGKLGKGPFFVAEADESDGSFLRYHPFGAIITNMEPDHMEYFGSLENLSSHFEKFFSQVESEKHLFYCGDDPGLMKLAKKGVSYGFGKDNELKVENYAPTTWGSNFDLHFEGKSFLKIELSLIGRHNALNAAAVFGLALRLGATEEDIRRALEEFGGVGRRAEKKGVVSEVLCLDDYAHHPTEVLKTLRAIKETIGPRRLIALFQPHRYSRLQYQWEEFTKVFESADHLFVTDIYSAGEEPIDGISSENLLKNIQKNSELPCSYVPYKELKEIVASFVRPHDVVVTLGAGSITAFHNDFIPYLEQHGVKKYVVGLVFGGLSCEHEISLRSARHIKSSLNSALYDVKYLGIDKGGMWVIGKQAEELLDNAVAIEKGTGQNILSPDVGKEINACDLFFPVLHGPNGEDGTIQGFFEMLHKPYTGPDFRGASIAMDKALTKRLLILAGVPTAPFLSFERAEWKKNRDEILTQIDQTLKFPLFVKAVHMGSSIGVYKVKEREALENAICQAFRYDTIVLVEEGQEGCRELEFAVLGNDIDSIRVPNPGEKLSGGEFVDYDLKYSQNHVKTTIEPVISEKDLENGKKFAQMAYQAIGMTGMSRIDCLLSKQGNFCFFEINPIPGLTKLSLFPKIWAREGLEGSLLADRLILLALERRREQLRVITSI